ncbi:MAG: HAMP domain-containing sensor histidine kinase [Pseudomonadota bacterium]
MAPGSQIDGLLDASSDLETQNRKLRRITEVLMNRVERNAEQAGDGFSLFQRAIALEGEVNARTVELQRTLDLLNRANLQLTAASAAAEEANRAKSRFVAAASHDVRQPLTAAKLYLEQIARTDLDPNQENIVGQLSSAFRSVESIIGSLLDISRLDSSATRAELSAFPVTQVLEPVIEEFLPLAARNGLDLWCIPSSAWVLSDPFYLRQIIQNYVSNAVHHVGHGRVLVGCRKRGNDLEIQVFDTGPGLTETERKLIFAEFKRLPNKTGKSGTGEGVGLGLAIVERAAKLLKHPLALRSIPGRGSMFSVRVPTCPPQMTADEQSEGFTEETAEARIVLLLTGNIGLSDQIITLLDGWGMACICATTPEDARRSLGHLGIVPDAIVIDEATFSDHQLSEIDGQGALPARHIRLSDGSDARSGLADMRTDTVVLSRPLRPHRLRAALA